MLSGHKTQLLLSFVTNICCLWEVFQGVRFCTMGLQYSGQTRCGGSGGDGGVCDGYGQSGAHRKGRLDCAVRFQIGSDVLCVAHDSFLIRFRVRVQGFFLCVMFLVCREPGSGERLILKEAGAFRANPFTVSGILQGAVANGTCFGVLTFLVHMGPMDSVVYAVLMSQIETECCTLGLSYVLCQVLGCFFVNVSTR